VSETEKEFVDAHSEVDSVERGFDWRICMYVIIILTMVVTAVFMDDIMDIQKKKSDSYVFILLNAIIDICNNVIFGLGYLLPAVSYRIIALRIHALADFIERDFSTLTNLKEKDRLRLSEICVVRQRYEQISADLTDLNNKISTIMAIILLATLMSMSNILHDFFRKGFNPANIDSIDIARILIFFSACLILIAFSAAEPANACDRLAEACAKHHLSGRLQAAIADILETADEDQNIPNYGSMDTLVSSDSKGKTMEKNLHKILEALSLRVRNHPAQAQIGCSDVTPEIANGIVLMALSIVAAIVGIHMPDWD